jgi:hypothetical protein
MIWYSFVYNWSSQKDGPDWEHVEAARDRAGRDQDRGEVAQVPVRPARRFALPGFDPDDLGSGHDAVGPGPVALALVWRHPAGLRSTHSHALTLPPLFSLKYEDCNGTDK